MIRKFRRNPCDHSPLIAELEALRAANARLTAQLATFKILHWMYAAIVQRDRQATAERQRAERMQQNASEPTAVYATEHIRRQV